MVTQRSHHVQLEVETVWRGPDLAPLVWVVGGGDAGEAVGVGWVRGQRFLVLTSPEFETNDCIATRVDAVDDLAALSPAAVRRPVPDGVTGAQRTGGVRVVALATVGLLVSATGVLWWRRRT